MRSLWFLIVLLLAGCAASAPPADLAQGAQVMRQMMSRKQLERAGFYEAVPNPKPSDFVSYIGSDLGSVLWPMAEDSSFLTEADRENARTVGEILIPAGVTYSRDKPDPEKNRQIVYRADDAAGEVVVEAYETPSGEPVAVYRWKLP